MINASAHQWKRALHFLRTERTLVAVVILALLIAGLFLFVAKKPELREWLGPTAGVAAALGAILAAASAFSSRTVIRWIIVLVGGGLTGWAAWYSTVDLSGDLKKENQQLFDDDRRLRAAKQHLTQIAAEFSRESVLTRTGSLLGEEFKIELHASDFAKHRRPQDFGVSEDLIEFARSIDGKNGHVLYYQGEIDRKIGRSDKGRESFMAYLEEEPGVCHARDGGPLAKACRTPRGYCLQRTAWINHLLANDFYEDAKAKMAKGVDPAEIQATLKPALKYGCAAVALFRKSGFADPDQLKPTLALVELIEKELGVSACPNSLENAEKPGSLGVDHRADCSPL